MMFGVTVNSVASLAFAFLAPYRPPLNALSTYASIYLYLSLSISHTIERFFFFWNTGCWFLSCFWNIQYTNRIRLPFMPNRNPLHAHTPIARRNSIELLILINLWNFSNKLRYDLTVCPNKSQKRLALQMKM